MKKKMSQMTVWMCALAFACVASGDIIRVGDGGGNPDFVDGTWPAGSVVELVGPVVVGNGTSLTIGEGTVVKADQGASLHVQGGGSLTAQGTAEAPVRFTASHTYRAPGEDGVSSTWEGVSVAGTADLVHTELLYGGSSTQGLLTVRSGGVVRMDRSLVAHSTGAGIWNIGELWVTNSAVYDTAIAGVYLARPGGKGDSMAQFTHCVIDRSELGVYQNGGDGVFANCVISDYRTYGATYLDGVVTFERCNFYSDRGILPSASPLEANRRLEVAPCFVDPEHYDFRLKQESGLIDAGDAVAGAMADAFGNERTNASHVAPTGTADTNGQYPDIGLHEWQPTYTDEDVDIFVQNIHVTPTEAKTGDSLTVTWTLVNAGSNAFSGTWRDGVSLVPSDGAEVVLGESERTGTIAGGEVMECSATFVVPPVANRTWEVKVVADADGGVKEKMGASDANENLSFEVLTTQADVWNVGSALNVEILSGCERVLFIEGGATNGQSLKVSGAGTGWTVEGAHHGLPTSSYAWKSIRDGDGAVWLWVPGTAEGTEAYLVLRNEGAGSATLLLQGGGTGIQIFGTDRSEVTISANTSVTADGIGLEAGVTGILQKEGTDERYEAALGGTGAIRRHAIFDLSEASEGPYRFGISDGEATAWLDGTITVKVAETGAVLRTTTMMPVQSHAGVTYEGFVYYVNEGDADMWLPEFVVRAGTSGDTMLSASPDGPFDSTSLFLKGWSPTEPAVVLKAGENGQVSFYYQAVQGLDIQVTSDSARTAEEYRQLQDDSDEAQRQSDAQAEQELASENLTYPTGNESMTSGQISGHLLMIGTETPVEGVELTLVGTAGRSSAAEGSDAPMAQIRWEECGTVRTDETGYFHFTNLPVGSTFVFRTEDAELEPSPQLEFENYEEPVLQDITLFINAYRWKVSGQLVGPDGEHVAGATVRIWSDLSIFDTETDEGGEWSFSHLPEGGYTVQAMASPGYAQSEQVELSVTENREVVLEVVTGGRLEVTIMQEGTETPIGNLGVLVCDAETGDPCDRAQSDEFGHVVFPGLAPGNYLVVAEYGEWELSDDSEAIAVEDGATSVADFFYKKACFFEAWPPVGEAPLTVSMDFFEEENAYTNIQSWKWDFDGDGQVDSTNQYATFTYVTNGIYDITLQITDGEGNETEYCLKEGVEVIEHQDPVLKSNVILLRETNLEYRVLSVTWGEADTWEDVQGELVVTQLIDSVVHHIGTGTVFVLDYSPIPGGYPFLKVTSVSSENGIWRMGVIRTKALEDIFESIQIAPHPMNLEDESGNPMPHGRRGLHQARKGDGESGKDHEEEPEHHGEASKDHEEEYETLLWTSDDRYARLNYSFENDGWMLGRLHYSEAAKGMKFQFLWIRHMAVGLHLHVDPKAKGKLTFTTNFLSGSLQIPAGELGFQCLRVGLTARITNTITGTLTWDEGSSVDSWLELQWNPRIDFHRYPRSGGLKTSITGTPFFTFHKDANGVAINKWELSGNDASAAVSFHTEASIAYEVQVADYSIVKFVDGWAYFDAKLAITQLVGSAKSSYDSSDSVGSFASSMWEKMKLTSEWTTDYGANLDFLSLRGTIFDEKFGVDWALFEFPLFGKNPNRRPKLNWPFSFGGKFKWPKLAWPDFKVDVSCLFGGIPTPCLPNIPPDHFSGWTPPRWPGFNWKCGSLHFPKPSLLNYPKNQWTFKFPKLKMPGMPDLDLGCDLLWLLRNGDIDFRQYAGKFHFPFDLKGFDFDAPVIFIPDISIPFKDVLLDLALPDFNIGGDQLEWLDRLGSLVNEPLELYWDWGDGGDPYTLDLQTQLKQLSNGEFNLGEELNKWLKHEYEKPGIYQIEVGIRFSRVNFINKHYRFTLVVANPDLDGDGMPNMWEVLYQSKEEGVKGLNPLDKSDGGEDFDGDGLTNLQEFLAGTNPLDADIDNDGMPDAFEVMYMVPPQGEKYTGLNPWEHDGDGDADKDGLFNFDEYQYKSKEEGEGNDFGPDNDDFSSTNPMNPDTDGGGMTDGEEYKSLGTDAEKDLFDGTDDTDKCCPQKCEHAVWDEVAKEYKCEPLENCEQKEKPESPDPCIEFVPGNPPEDENGCPVWIPQIKDECKDKEDPEGECRAVKEALLEYCAVCKDGFWQWMFSKVHITRWVDCMTPSGGGGYVIDLSKGEGGRTDEKHSDGPRVTAPDGCGKTKNQKKPDPRKKNDPPTPNVSNDTERRNSAVYLVMGDYIDSKTDLPVRMGGATAGLKRYLQENEWTFWEAGSGLALAPTNGVEGEVSVGTGRLGVEWNGSGAPGAVSALRNDATGVSLKSVPTGLWGPWNGTTQALIRVEYGVLKGNGSVATNYGELVKAWRSAVEAGDTVKASSLEAVGTNGFIRVTAAEDAEGRRTSYEWNGSGQMTAAHFADGTQETYEYGSGGLMSGKRMRDGVHVGLAHDNYGYLTGYNDTKYEYTYDSGSTTFYTAIRYPDGRMGERWYDEDGKLFRHAMNGSVVFDEATVKADVLLTTKPAWPKETLNDEELPMLVEYRSGATESFTWDGPGYARTSVAEATGEERAWTYDGAGREMSETRDGVSVSVERDGAGQVTRSRLDSASGTEEAEWEWDVAGNASSGRMGGWTRTNTYDLAGRVLTSAGADGGMWTFVRDSEGRVTEWTQPDGTSGAKAYDGRGRLTWRRSPGGVETWWWHATNGLLATWSNSLGRKVSYQYDRGDRVAKATDESGDVTTYAYDAAGNWRGLAPELRTFVNDGEGGLSTTVTNGGRVTQARRQWETWLLRDVQANDLSWRLERNEEGQVTGLVRAPTEGVPTTNRWTYDVAGRLAGWTDATGISVSRGYDAAGFVAWETNGGGGVRRWSHDGTGRLTGVTDAAGRTSVFDYDPASGTTTATLADGSELDLQFDAWGREIGRTDAAETAIATERRFDGAVLRKTWTAAGATSAGLEATWTRDGDGRLVRQGMTGGPATRTEWTDSNRCERTVTEYGTFEAGAAVRRDAEGRLTAAQGPDGEWAECVWGDDGEISGWMLPEGSVWFARKLSDRTRTMLLPSGQLMTEHVDLWGRVTNVALAGADGTVVWSLSLARDAAGRIVRQGSETLEWDGAERVVSVGGTAYARDAAGNRSGSGWMTEGMDRLTSWPGGTYGYDTNGAVVSRTSGASELRFIRDLAGRVTEIRNGSDGLVARFSYDTEGRRLSKEAGNGSLTWYLWCGNRLAAELSGEGTVERVYGYWTEETRSPDWVRTGGELYVVLKDGFGAPTALVSASDGMVTEATVGTVFGEGWACAALPVWADGLIADAETGLMAGPDGRLYDPATGRWLSPTPGALEAGLNLYAWEPTSKGVGREFPGLSMPGVAPEYDVMYAFARRCGADPATAAALARAELLLGLEGRSDPMARRWLRMRDEATTAAGLRLLGGLPASQVVCARKGVESFLKARRDVLAVTTELDAYGTLRSAMDLEEAFRLELAWSGEPEDRASMGAWRGTWGWAGLRPEGIGGTQRWLALLLHAGNGERLSEEELEWLGEAKLLALSDWVRPVTPSLDTEKMRESASEDMAELRQVLQIWAKECK